MNVKTFSPQARSPLAAKSAPSPSGRFPGVSAALALECRTGCGVSLGLCPNCSVLGVRPVSSSLLGCSPAATCSRFSGIGRWMGRLAVRGGWHALVANWPRVQGVRAGISLFHLPQGSRLGSRIDQDATGKALRAKSAVGGRCQMKEPGWGQRSGPSPASVRLVTRTESDKYGTNSLEISYCETMAGRRVHL